MFLPDILNIRHVIRCHLGDSIILSTDIQHLKFVFVSMF